MSDPPGINHDTAARLLGITPGELSALVRDGIISRAGKDNYSLPVLVRDYCNHLRNPSRIWTQAQIGEHLDISDRSVRETCERLGLDNKKQTVDEIRIAYIRHLRELAAGRAAAGDIDLVTERALLAREQKDRIALQNAVTRREYGPIVELELAVADTMARVASLLDTIPGKLKRASDRLAVADLEVVGGVLSEVRNTIADMEIPWFSGSAENDDEDMSDDLDDDVDAAADSAA